MDFKSPIWSNGPCMSSPKTTDSSKVSCLKAFVDQAHVVAEDPCSAPKNIKNSNAHEHTCRQGESIVSRTGCTPQCNPGYTPDTRILNCNSGQLSPPTYVCEPDPCRVHQVLNSLDSGCKGVEHPAIIEHGSSCQTQCQPGYSPSVKEQSCYAGRMTPTFWTCEPDPCDAPTGVPNSVEPCKEGKSITSGYLCTAQCAAGYSPSVPSLFCSLGQLSPATFTCNPDPCPIPQVQNRLGSGCKAIKGKSVTSGSSCTPLCKAGFSPTESLLECSASKLTPATWVCEPDPCIISAPTENAYGTGCNGGMSSHVASGSDCTATCVVGHEPSETKLSCYAGVFSPARFTCDPSPCSIPQVSNKAGSGCVGVPTASITSGATCTPHCIGGYSPSEKKLTCEAGMLSPATFECTRDPCSMPIVTGCN